MWRSIPILLLAFAAVADDSPLVALAKKTSANRKTTRVVITNETIAKTTGKISMTGGEGKPEAQTTSAATVPALPTTYVPAAAAAKPKPQVPNNGEPPSPYSTARSTDPVSTVRNVPPPASAATQSISGVQRRDPDSTAKRQEPSSSVLNTNPPSSVTPPQ